MLRPVQWRPEYLTRSVFEWSKAFQLVNGSVFKYHLKTKLKTNEIDQFGGNLVFTIQNQIWNVLLTFNRSSVES